MLMDVFYGWLLDAFHCILLLFSFSFCLVFFGLFAFVVWFSCFVQDTPLMFSLLMKEQKTKDKMGLI